MCKCSFVLVAWLAVACLAAAQDYPVGYTDDAGPSVRSAQGPLIFDSTEVVVNPGQQLALNCGIEGRMRSCVWSHENGKIIQVVDVYEGLSDGYSKPQDASGNQCGIVVDSVSTEDHGKWTCTVYVPGDSLVASKNVVVTIKPTNPILVIDDPNSLQVTTTEERSVVCSVAAARPAVDVKWFLGDKDLTASSETVETPDAGNIYKSESTLMRKFRPDDNGKTLVCSISHKTLATSDNASVPISVKFKPIEKEVTTFYQIPVNIDYEVKFNFSANPKPYMMMWKYGENLDNPEGSINIPGLEGRYTADFEDLGNDKYTAKLVVKGFNLDDANKKYFLLVENDVGQTQYTIMLSVHDAPIDGVSETSNHDKIPTSELSVSDFDETESNPLSGGAIAGIIIVLLVVVVAIVAAAYARYRQMFCFAPIGSPDLEAKDIREEHSDTESARGPAATHPVTFKDRLGQLTKVFKKQKTDQDVKMDDVEKKSLTKDEINKEAAHKECSPEEKEVVYAELDLTKGEAEKKAEVMTDDKTEYAQIVGTVTDNREDEKKE